MRSLGSTEFLHRLTTTLCLPAKRWLLLVDEVEKLDAMLDALTHQHAGRLREQFGVGTQTAAVLLSTAGDNPEWLRNEASFAALCGVNPLPASSGKTVRHRLNRGGNRAANNALWTIAMVRMREIHKPNPTSHDVVPKTYLHPALFEALYCQGTLPFELGRFSLLSASLLT
ncbi:IS110 family transposase [Aeromonas hydrophila]|nr:IS110 family transposase [Aeromonas hydrophila]